MSCLPFAGNLEPGVLAASVAACKVERKPFLPTGGRKGWNSVCPAPPVVG
ncbi:hypothetical protein DFE_2611 [Desulfovibrio ferrophilus]|uniref:Uncharacterized protein n=1 Tax=Desulfovibrio ferrophilus TaxID=241368 RepID=A0A2Z6B1D6_9BACT|nr:hypothetical protein DFE_2611 [Desulfovibrio ferrophilus]